MSQEVTRDVDGMSLKMVSVDSRNHVLYLDGSHFTNLNNMTGMEAMTIFESIDRKTVTEYQVIMMSVKSAIRDLFMKAVQRKHPELSSRVASLGVTVNDR